MSVATSTAVAIAGVAGAAGSVGSSMLSSSAAGKAANAQATAAERAAELQHEDAQAALDFNKEVYGNEQANEKPFIEAGQGAIKNLSDLTQPGGGLMTPWTEQFQAPTDVTEQNDPGYKFRLDQGTRAIQSSAAAQGNLLTGGTLKSLNQFGQDYGSNEYQNVYNRSLTDFQQRYNIFQQNQSNQFNRLAAVAGIGQVGTGQMNSAGTSASGNNANILLGSGAQIGQDMQNAAAARASGYIGSSNAIGSGISSLSSLGNIGLLMKMFGGGAKMNDNLFSGGFAPPSIDPTIGAPAGWM